YLAGWNYVACAALITFDVVGRSLFGVTSTATVEVTSYMLACGIAWSPAHTLAPRAPIRVDGLANRMPVRIRAWPHLLSLTRLALAGGRDAGGAGGGGHGARGAPGMIAIVFLVALLGVLVFAAAGTGQSLPIAEIMGLIAVFVVFFGAGVHVAAVLGILALLT